MQGRADLQESPGMHPEFQRVKSQQNKWSHPSFSFFSPLPPCIFLPVEREWAGSGWEDTELNQEEGARFDNGKWVSVY